MGGPQARAALSVALLLGVALGLRSLTLGVDPPDYPRFGAAWGDEGPWAWPASHRAETGSWPEAGRVFVRAAPVHAWLLAWSYEVLPGGLLVARALSLLAGLGTLALLWWTCRRHLGDLGAGLAGALYATGLWPILYERHASPEALAIFLATASFAALMGNRAVTRAPVAVLLAVLAFATKGALIFFPPLAVLAVISMRGEASDRPESGRGWTLGGLALGACSLALFSLQLSETFRFVATVPAPPSTALAGLAAAGRRLAMAPFNADFSLSAPVALAGVVLAALSGIPDSPGARKLFLLSAGWVTCWWLVVPVFDLKGSRYYLIAPPFMVLGSMGWLGLTGPSWHPLGRGETRRAVLLRTVMGSLAACWIAALGAIEWSIQGGPRARSSFPFLALAAFGLAVGLSASWRSGSAGWVVRVKRSLAPLLLIGVFVSQVPWWWRWSSGASTLVTDAVAQMARSPELRGHVCGDQAPLLLLGQPGGAEALYNVYWPTCSMDGRDAEWVVVTAEPLCAPFEGAWIRDRRPELLARRPEITLNLPGTPPAPRSCIHYIVRLE